MNSKLTYITAAFLLLGAAQARPLSAIKASGTLKLVTSADFKPFNYREGDKLMGFEVELGNALAAQMKLKPSWGIRPFQKLLNDVNTDAQNVDVVIASHAITSTRLKEVEFSTPHYCTGGVIVSRPGGPSTAKELERHNVSSQLGSTYQGFLRKLPFEVNSLPTLNDTESLKNVINRKAEAAVTDRLFALDFNKMNPGAGLQISKLLWQETEGMVVAKGNKELLQALNAALKQLINNGTYSRLSQKYFGENIACGN